MIEDDTIKAYLDCSYKAFQLISGKLTQYSDYEKFILNQQNTIRDKLLTSKIFHEIDSLDLIFKSSRENYRIKNTFFILDQIKVNIEFFEVNTEDQILNITPIFYNYTQSLTSKDRLYFAIKCLVLESQIANKIQNFIYFNTDLKSQRVNLENYKRDAIKIINQLQNLGLEKSPPKFIRKKECVFCESQKSCLKELQEKDCISLLGNTNEKIVKQYNKKGLFTINQLSYTFRPRKNVKRYYHELKALAIRENRIYSWEKANLQEFDNEIFIDIEYLPNENFIYLIGILVKNSTGSKFYSYWLDSPNESKRFYHDIIELIDKENTGIFYFGSAEKKLFKDLEANGLTINSKNTYNLLSYVSNNIYFPTYTNSLKDISNYIGFSWDDEIQNGLKSIEFRKKWEMQKDASYKDQLIRYNKNDCKALYSLICKIRDLEQDKSLAINITSLRKESIYKWRNTDDYFEEGLNEINKLSYFTYNQDKIYVRTNTNSYKSLKRRNSHSKKQHYKPNEIIEVLPQKCPKCKTVAKKNLSNRIKPTNRIVIDLKFMRNGIKRWIVKYNGGIIKCLKCSHKFSPQNVYQLKMFGDNLKKYCVNQHISHHVSFNSIAASLIDFNIHINKIRVFEFKQEIAQKYKETYIGLRKKLFSSNLIQIDETEIKLDKKRKGYIWVFSNMDTVYYLYREDRKASFLKDFLNGFSGVILSDFYKGYDSLNQPQQKCLVHLLRDINSDFFHNQLDRELKYIIKLFGALLKEIVSTIDKYGLKKRHLNKHIRMVDKFYKEISDNDYNSDLATKYQKRFLSYREKLFTFLHYDNVPWHNNNAEYAIKSFAKHREKGNRIFTESSIDSYSILLSIEQSCKYRGIRFMDFLMDSSLLE